MRDMTTTALNPDRTPDKEPRKLTIAEHCVLVLSSLDAWSQVSKEIDQTAYRRARLAVIKSCLLDRMIYKGEGMSQTPCPVHKGKWSGIQFGWPGTTRTRTLPDGTVETSPEPGSPRLREWYDAGCRCFMHRCGCTTGWRPDEACGCGTPA